MLAALAKVTSHLKLCTGILQPHLRNPVTLAQVLHARCPAIWEPSTLGERLANTEQLLSVTVAARVFRRMNVMDRGNVLPITAA